MDINNFSQLWQHENKLFKMEQSQELWDLRADEFNRNSSGGCDERKDNVLHFFAERNIFNAATQILDIGCGPGRFSIEFAKMAKQVVGIDISPKMIQYAKQNTANERLNNAYYETVAWEAVDLDVKGWRKEYDLVFASMSPGISDGDALLKMCEASKGYCFMSGCIEKKDEIDDQLYCAIFGEDPLRRGNNLYYSLNILFLSGYYPEILYHDIECEQVLNVEQAVEKYCTQLKLRKQVNADMRKQIADYLGGIANNGLITEKTRSKIAWIFWKVPPKRHSLHKYQDEKIYEEVFYNVF